MALVPTGIFAQQEDCFKKWFDRGVKAFAAYDMRAAVANFDAALECDSISTLERLDIENWKKNIDLELQRLVEEFDAAQGQKEAFKLIIVDEKIGTSVALTGEKAYLKSNDYLKNALGLTADLPDRDRTSKKNAIESLIRKNDSLLIVQNKFLKLIGDGNFLSASGPKNVIPALSKYLEAAALDFDSGVTNAKISAIKETTFNCLSQPCFPAHNREDVYFSLASCEQLLGNAAGARDYVKSGLKASKMKYYPGNPFYPPDIRKYADEMCNAYYWAKNILFYHVGEITSFYNVKKAAFTDPYKTNYLSTGQHLKLTVDWTKGSNSFASPTFPQIMVGYFRGRKFIYGAEFTGTIKGSGSSNMDTDFEFTYANLSPAPVDTLRIFRGDFPKYGYQFDFLLGYQIPVVKKKSNKHIAVFSILPMFGPSVRINAPWKNLEFVERFTSTGIDKSSEIRYFFPNLKSTSQFLAANLYVNIRIADRVCFFAGVVGRIALADQKILLPAKDVIKKEIISSYEGHRHFPLDFEWIFRERQFGGTIIGFSTRF